MIASLFVSIKADKLGTGVDRILYSYEQPFL